LKTENNGLGRAHAHANLRQLADAFAVPSIRIPVSRSNSLIQNGKPGAGNPGKPSWALQEALIIDAIHQAKTMPNRSVNLKGLLTHLTGAFRQIVLKERRVAHA
jgi:hypothetical protein